MHATSEAGHAHPNNGVSRVDGERRSDLSYKTVLVHAEPRPLSDGRLALARQIAELFDASIVGVGAEAFEPVIASGDAIADGAMVQAVQARLDTDLPAAERAFHALIATPGRPTQWYSAVNFPVKELARHACGADLIIASRPQRQAKPTFAADPADLVLQAGIPVLLAPDQAAEFRGDKIVVGWKNTREARRALTDALPFLVRASEVAVVAVAGEGDAKGRHAELNEVARRLARHGVEVRTELVVKHGAACAEDLERAATRAGADMIVLGAFGHSHLREWALGGMTEDLLASSSKFILFSH